MAAMIELVDSCFKVCEDVPLAQREAVFAELAPRYPQFTPRKVRAILANSAFDLEEGTAKLDQHSLWYEEMQLASPPPVDVEAALISPRFRYIGLNREKRGVIIVNAMRGHFMDGITEEVATRAWVRWMETTFSRMDEEPGAFHSTVHIIVGGMPPYSLAKELTPMIKTNFPGRLFRCVVLAPSVLQSFGQGLLSFMPEQVQRRFVFAATKDELLEHANLDKSSWPEDLDVDNWTGQERWSDRRPNGELDQYFRQCVGAGRAELIEVEITADESRPPAQFMVMVEEDQLSVNVLFELGEEGVAELVQQRVAAGEDLVDELDSSWTGTLRFELDNTESWWTAKTVTVKVVTNRATL
eukprot:NODE_9855_length_1394_cov_7.000789.p1 GENE.NODE_9855_length_1394_cov_7.000789~~NODE_9855_length_1394_cov_7.000789.p1  ORF type:complete len:355 (-),score=103.73 NODE_9855_length_1394_cov_7.000789:228-1292(-)